MGVQPGTWAKAPSGSVWTNGGWAESWRGRPGSPTQKGLEETGEESHVPQGAHGASFGRADTDPEGVQVALMKSGFQGDGGGGAGRSPREGLWRAGRRSPLPTD